MACYLPGRSGGDQAVDLGNDRRTFTHSGGDPLGEPARASPMANTLGALVPSGSAPWPVAMKPLESVPT
jgi:hypothetical protein